MNKKEGIFPMKYKHFCSILLVLVLLCTCLTGTVAEEEEREIFTDGDYEYALLDDGTVEITKYTGEAEELYIPDTLNGQTVTSIGHHAFFGSRSLRSVFIPDSVVFLGDRAFSDCDFLSSVSIPDSVAKIGDNPFAFCKSLKDISISPSSPYFTVIDGVLFDKSLKCLIAYPVRGESSSYNIPQGITSIGNYAFANCTSLSSVSIPNSVTSIGDKAFYLCFSLTAMSIPDSVVQIDGNPFGHCSSLESFSVSPNQPYFAAVDGVLFRKADKTLIAYPASKEASVYNIPQGISAIGDFAFSSCYSLTSVSIPDSVVSLGDSAFAHCSLTTLFIPDSVTSIGKNAFYGCPDFTLSLPRNSYAAEYAKANNIPYTYPDANDWLNN